MRIVDGLRIMNIGTWHIGPSFGAHRLLADGAGWCAGAGCHRRHLGWRCDAGEIKFETRLTFVSPKGGVSRYPRFPCGGIQKGNAYEFNETVTWGGTDEKADGCIPGVVPSPSTATR